MAFTEMAFNPTDGLLNTTSYPTQPADEAAARAQLQAPSNQIRDFINNTLLSELGSSEVGADGAGKIGSEAIDGVTGTTVQAKLVAIKALIDALSVSASGLSAGVVETAFLADLAVTAAKLAADAVETLKIKNAAVTEDKLADGAVTENKIADGAVTGNKIAVDTISYLNITPRTISGYRIGLGAIEANNLAANAVVSKHCRVSKTSLQTLTSGITAAIAFNNEEYDTDTMHNNATNNTRITINTTGVYIIVGELYVASNEATNIAVVSDGGDTLNNATFVGGDTHQVVFVGELTAGHYVEIKALFMGGTTAGVTGGYFSAARIGAIS
jgi:hypothetical protein